MTVNIYNWLSCSKPIAPGQVLTLENLEQILKYNDVMLVRNEDGTINMFEDVKGGKFRCR